MPFKNVLKTDEILQLAKDLNFKEDFKIGFTYEEISKLISNGYKKVGYYIFNLLGFSKKDKQIGHYIACIILPKQRLILIYTCFGIVSFDVIKMFYDDKNYKDFNLVFDLSQDQIIKSNSCGWYCLRWLKEFERTDKITLENFVIYSLIKYPVIPENVNISMFYTNKNWSYERYKKYIDVYLKIIDEL